MNIRELCFATLCLILSIDHSVSQFDIGALLNEFEGGYNNFNNQPSRNSFQPQYPQQSQHQHHNRISSSSGNCDQFWAYDSDYNGQYGLIRISRPDYRSSVLRIVLSVAVRLPSQHVGSLKLTKSIEGAVSDISQGLPLFYRVDFPSQNPVPHITELYYNDQLLCSAPRVTGSFVTTITLDHNLKTGLTHPPPFQPEQPWNVQPPQPDIQTFTEEYIPVVTTRRPPATRPTTRYTTQPPRRTTTQPPRRVTTTQRPFEPPVSFDDDQCGVPDYKPPTTTALIIRGMEVNRGQFPWLAALYYSPQNDQSGFICGGSLISRKLVVTAAHCIQRKEDNEASRIKADEILFHFGKRNLQTLESEEGHIFSAVRDVYIHPDWDYRTQDYDADISIAVLSRTIIFNKYVKPICLWTSTNSFDDLVGLKGVVAGWGVDENKVVTTAKPKWARIPVVTTEACLRSHSSFRTLTSERTFCAGESLSSRVGGSGPCNGDSGGGFVVQNGGKWYLRGIISAAIVDPESGTCNPENFSVFTDATKFTSWIQNYVSQYG